MKKIWIATLVILVALFFNSCAVSDDDGEGNGDNGKTENNGS